MRSSVQLLVYKPEYVTKNVEKTYCDWMNQFDPHLNESLVNMDFF